MLSICIPTYNVDSRPLINDLVSQLRELEHEVQLLLIDDASATSFRDLYKDLPPEVEFEQLEENIGRSRIRNLLAEKASQAYLLFLDGDSTIVSEQFIKRYLDLLEKEKDLKVVCGGSVYSDKAPEDAYLLRWSYSKAREKKSEKSLNGSPYRSFTSNNFLIEREVFLTIRFDERLKEYGHEDTLLGFRLMENRVPIFHLKNYVLNANLDANGEFLHKTRQGISNLLEILDFLDYDQKFIDMVPLLKYYFRIKLLGGEIFLRWWFRLFRPSLERSFIEGKVQLRLFDLYRLGVLSTLFRRRRV
jgi:glycosyltransferase involved in cell wall biosynthesis